MIILNHINNKSDHYELKEALLIVMCHIVSSINWDSNYPNNLIQAII